MTKAVIGRIRVMGIMTRKAVIIWRSFVVVMLMRFPESPCGTSNAGCVSIGLVTGEVGVMFAILRSVTVGFNLISTERVKTDLKIRG
jgi:hypothetical protein